MPNVDFTLPELLAYKPELTAQPDFDSFWERARKESAVRPMNVRVTPVNHPASHAEVCEVVYDGFDGSPIHGWYVVPTGGWGKAPMPAVVRYHGYHGNRGNPHELLMWAAMGVAAFSVDTRGQGGLSPDRAVYPEGSAAGWMTQGILDPETYYYRNVYMDCVRALDFVCGREEIDASRIAVYGFSQGGGLTLAVAGIDSRPKLAMPVYPYLCHFGRSVEQHAAGPYAEIKNWFRRFDPEHKKENQVYRTLSYFDGMNFAPRIGARTLMAITLQDQVCPPSACFAAYNHLPAEKEKRIYHDFGHENLPFFEEEMMRFAGMYL